MGADTADQGATGGAAATVMASAVNDCQYCRSHRLISTISTFT